MHEAFKLLLHLFLRFVSAIAHHYVLRELGSHVTSQFCVVHKQLEVIFTTMFHILGCWLRLRLQNYVGLVLGAGLPSLCLGKIIYRR